MSGQVCAYGTNYTTLMVGPVILAYGAEALRVSGWARNMRNNFGIKPRWRRFIARPDAPVDEAWTDGTVVSSDTRFSEDLSLATATLGSHLWVQPAIAGGLTAAGNGGDGFVGWQAFTKGNGALVARQTVVLKPLSNTNPVDFLPLGKPFPALGLQGLMFAVVASGCSGSPSINFVTRTYEGDLSMPSSGWGANLLGANKVFSTTNTDYNTGDIVYAPTDTGWAQAGLKVTALDAYGTLDIIVAARYA